ncbi:MAG: PAS domain S-box protein [Acidobacteria bacterium]|nr:PAS domain S-box protein [Acidobacteriota bacterium]
MSGLVDRLRAWIFPSAEPDPGKRAFQGLSFLGGLLSLGVVIPANALQKLPLGVNLSVLAFGLGSLVLHAQSRRGRTLYGTLIALYLVVLDALWFLNAGSQGPIALFFFPAAMYMVLFFEGWRRLAMLGLLFANGVTLIALERFRPAWVLPYPDPSARFFDLLTGFFLGNLICILILWILLANYKREQERTRQAMASIREGEQRFEKTFRAIPSALGITDLETGAFLEANEGFTDLFGFERAEVLGRRSADLGIWVSPAQRQEILRLLEEGERIRNIPFQVCRKDGGLRWVSYSAEKLTVDGRPCLLSTAQDITDRREAEEKRRAMESQLQHLQKLESLGRLAGGVAHDMNNVLSAILAVASVLEDKHPEGSPTEQELGKIKEAALRGRDLVKGLTDFARKDLQVQELIDLNQLLRGEASLLSRLTRNKVEVVLDLQEPLPSVTGDRSALGNMVMNLCLNAVDAMPRGGHLTLRTRAQAPGLVEFVVEDEGTGMSSEVRDRALEPFFTTKPVGQGTGLGLAVVFGTVQAHNGRLEIQSEPGQGTAVRVILPACAGRPAGAPAGKAVSVGLQRPLRILLVDDDPLIQVTAPAMLEAEGHRVRVARGGREALLVLEAGEAWDLVILDMNMPGMTGQDTFRLLRRLRPELPVLIATGFVDAGAEEILAGSTRVSLLAKPFTRSELVQVLWTISGG